MWVGTVQKRAYTIKEDSITWDMGSKSQTAPLISDAMLAKHLTLVLE